MVPDSWPLDNVERDTGTERSTVCTQDMSRFDASCTFSCAGRPVSSCDNSNDDNWRPDIDRRVPSFEYTVVWIHFDLEEFELLVLDWMTIHRP